MNVERLKRDILRYLNEFNIYRRGNFAIVINDKFYHSLSKEILNDLNSFSKVELCKDLVVSPFIEDDIIVLDNLIRPITDIRFYYKEDYYD